MWNTANGFVPVGGNNAADFTGTFNGQGYTVSNLTIIDTTQVAQTADGYPTNGAVGLFGIAGVGAVVENVNLVGAQVTGGDDMLVGALEGGNIGAVIDASSSGAVTVGDTLSTGAIAGGLVGGSAGSIVGSHSSAAVTGADAEVGGLVGSTGAGASIAGSFATGNVTTGADNGSQIPMAGGLVGNLSGYEEGQVSFITATVTGSYATGVVSGGAGSEVGGFAGYVAQAQIGTSYATGSVTQTASGLNQGNFAGGFVGVVDTGGAITQSWSGGAVNTVGGPDNTDFTYAGGFVGMMEDGGVVSDSYALGPVTSTGSSYSTIGGFAGVIQSSASANQVYATGLVTGPPGSEGLVGQVGNPGLSDTSGSVSNSYWDEGTTGQTNGYVLVGTGTATNVTGIGGSTGLSPYAAATYANFTFGTTPGASGWVIVDTDGTLNNNGGGAAGGTRPILLGEYSTTITDAHQLQLMSLNLGASYTLAGNVDASETTNPSGVWNPANGFVPVGGNGAAAFTGVLNGQGYTVSNLTIIDTTPVLGTTPGGNPTNGSVGLFGVVGAGGLVENINLVGANVTGGDGMQVGALVGGLGGQVISASSSGAVTTGDGVTTTSGLAYATAGGLVGEATGAITGSNSSAAVTGGDAYVGGLLGEADTGAQITGSFASGGVDTAGSSADQQDSSAGGLVGYFTGASAANSYATGAVSGGGGSWLGGLVGYVTQGQITTSWASGTVTQTAGAAAGDFNDNAAGGFVGAIDTGGVVTQSWSGGAVNTVGGLDAADPTLAGGFVGGMRLGAAVSDSYALGAVTSTGSSSAFLGGFAGKIQQSASVVEVYATGLVSGEGTVVGGLVGQVGDGTLADTSGSISNSYWDEGTTGQTTGYTLSGTGTATNVVGIGGPTGINPYVASTYANFDLTNTWYLIYGQTRPILLSEYSTTITNAHQLELMGLNLSADYTLANDIDASETTNPSGVWNLANGFVPVGGNGSADFTGALNGQGHTISNLTIIDTTPVLETTPAGYSTNGSVGLFGIVGAGGLIENINLANARVTGVDGMQVGALVGGLDGQVIDASSSGVVTAGSAVSTTSGSAYANAGGLVGDSNGAIVDSNSSATVTGADAYVGGLLGEADAGAQTSGTFASGAVSATGFSGEQQLATVGGLVGLLYGYQFGGVNPIPATVTTSYATGSVSGDGGSAAGGLAGDVVEGRINTSWSTGSVTQTAGAQNGLNNFAGGFVGVIYTGGAVTQSWSSGAVNTVGGNASDYTYAGGFVGWVNPGGAVSDAYSLGPVTTTGGFNYLGGFAGVVQSSQGVAGVYATGLVTGSGDAVGGLIGYLGAGASASNSYWDEGTTGQTIAVGNDQGTVTELVGIGAPTSLSPYASATYANFDLTNTWYLIEGETRPILRSEYSTTIIDAHQLQLMSLNLAASYTLAGNVDASETTNPAGVWNPANGFVPVGGNNAAEFTGVLDGQGHTISNLTIIDDTAVAQTFDGFPTNGAVGLFGVVGAGGVLQNLVVAGANVTGGDGMLVGALAGAVAGNVTNAASSGAVTTGAAA